MTRTRYSDGAKVGQETSEGRVIAMRQRLVVILLIALIFPMLLVSARTIAQNVEEQPPAGEVTPDKWPKTAEVDGAKWTIYQPQLESWDGYHLQAQAAVSVLEPGAKDPIFGVLKATAVTEVDRLSRIVHFYNLKIESVNFPSVPDKAAQFQNTLQTMLSQATLAPSLDRMQAALAVTQAEQKARSVPVQNQPPTFIFSQSPAVLVDIDGEPVWRSVEGSDLVRVLNTRALILGNKSGKVYLHLFDGFMEASTLSGPWTVAMAGPAGGEKIAKELAEKNVVDLMEGPPDEKTKKEPSLKDGAPKVIVVTAPTELIVTHGPPDWEQINGANLLYIKNTTGSIFKDLNNQYTYVLATGRWFRSQDMDGPWEHVDGRNLPSDFAAIPDTSPKENVKASVPGTPQAQEAVIANEIPQTARVDREKTQFTPQVSGSPELKPIPDTSMNYVFNSPAPIIMVSSDQWYAVHNGVWFTSSSLNGHWVVATSVPAVIYSIPPSSPVYYVTYVKIYDVTPSYVVVGYTPGYMGTVVDSAGVVVYGTGYAYVPYIGPTVWYSPPITYGYAANPTWTPWTGWIIGFGWAFGAAVSGHYCYAPAPYWGPMYYHPYYGAGYARGPYGGAAVWGPHGWAATTGNVYQRWGSTSVVSRSSAGYNAWTGNAWSSQVGRSYNSVTGRVSAGQRAGVENVYTGNYAYGKHGATYNPNTGVTARGGTATRGNVNTGDQGTATWGHAKGPGGQSASAAKVGNNYYAGHDGNVYRNTGDGWQKYNNGGWNNVQKPTQSSVQGSRQFSTDSLDAQKQARQAGDQRSAGSSWGSQGWGGGFDRSQGQGLSEGQGGLEQRPNEQRDRSFDSGGRSFGGGGLFGGGGSFGGGGRSWGGGDFGGGGFRGFGGGGRGRR